MPDEETTQIGGFPFSRFVSSIMYKNGGGTLIESDG